MTFNDFSTLDNMALLRDVLGIIARHPSFDDVAPVLLKYAGSLTGASAGFYLIFEAPRTLVVAGIEEAQLPSDDILYQAVNRLTDEPHLGTDLPSPLSRYAGWLIVPVRMRQRLVGALYLLFEGGNAPSEAMLTLLKTLVDGFLIITNSAMVSERHDNLTRNQYEFVRIVSHDLRSPLTSIRGFASMLESHMVGELNEKQTHYVGKILSGVTQMTALVDNIQDAGRYDPETGFYEMERKPLDLVEMVRNIVQNHLLPAEKLDLTITAETSEDVPIINADANMLERGIINLVDNAIKYTPNGGRIEVKVKRDDRNIVITVKDNGLGISRENLRQLFQRHFRIRRPEHRLVKGSGLGLFIVRSVALRHGGDAFVESVEGQGSTFGMTIPLTGTNLLGGSD